jgi:hypothetical protein
VEPVYEGKVFDAVSAHKKIKPDFAYSNSLSFIDSGDQRDAIFIAYTEERDYSPELPIYKKLQ